MDNAQKAIMIGVGLFITIIIISAVMLITSAGQDLINNSTTQVGNISSSLQAQLTSQFDETVLNGSQVISAIKANYTTSGMILTVYNTTGEITGAASNANLANYGDCMPNEYDGTLSYSVTKTTKIKSIKNNSNKIPIGKLSDATNTQTYVSPNAKYKAHLVKLSDSVVGLFFNLI